MRPKGLPKTGGRQKGSVNKTTSLIKDTLSQVFFDLQKDPKTCLKQFAKDYPVEFHRLVGRLIPTEITPVDGEGNAYTVTLNLTPSKSE